MALCPSIRRGKCKTSSQEVLKKEGVLKRLADTVEHGDSDGCRQAAKDAVASGIDAYEAIMEGCKKGMDIVSAKYDRGEVFVPEILLSADAMYAAIEVLKPHLDTSKAEATGTVVVGVVEGDVHDIGKNLVRMFLEASGYNVIDLGRDVQLDRFITTTKESQADVIAASTLMTTTLYSVEDLMKMLNESGLRKQVKVIIGGAATNAEFAESVGADAWGADASKGAKIVGDLIRQKREGK